MGVYEDVFACRAGARAEGWEPGLWVDRGWLKEGIVHKEAIS